MNPENLQYAESHEWVAVEGDVATVGISEFAVKLLTDIVFIDLPSAGQTVSQKESVGEIESVKAVSDLYAPVSGEVLEVNDNLASDLAALSDSPYDKGWMLKIRMSEPSQLESLLDHAAYEAHCAAQG